MMELAGGLFYSFTSNTKLPHYPRQPVRQEIAGRPLIHTLL